MSNSQYKRMTGARAWLAAVGLVSASVRPLASGPATANAGSVSLPTAPEMLETEQLAVLAEVQTPEEISEVVAEAGPEQWVQLYVDSDTFEYKAAVLLEKPPVPAEAPADQKPSANPEITPYAVSVCGSGVPQRAPSPLMLHRTGTTIGAGAGRGRGASAAGISSPTTQETGPMLAQTPPRCSVFPPIRWPHLSERSLWDTSSFPSRS